MRPTPIQPILYLPNSAMLNLPLTIRVALQSGTEAVAYLPKAGNALPAAWVDARASQEARNGRSLGQQRVPDPRQHEGGGVTVEVHAGCGRCERCREGMYTSCLNYGEPQKGRRANGFTTDGGFAQYAINHVNTLVHVPDDMSDAEATLVVTAGTSMYGLDVLGGLIAGEGVVVSGPGPIGLLGVAVAKALGADPVILTGTRDARLELGKKLGADHVVNIKNENAVAAGKRITKGKGVQFVVECSGAPDAMSGAAQMVNRGGRICLAAFPQHPVPVDLAYLVRNNIYVFGIRGEGRGPTHPAMALMKQKRFDAKLIHTHTFPLAELPTALKYARERIEDAIKVVVKVH